MTNRHFPESLKINNEKKYERDYKLWRFFSYCHNLIAVKEMKELRRLKLTRELASIITAVHFMDHDPMPIELARLTRRKPSTISSSIKLARKKGLIIKTIDNKRRNSFRVSLTNKGQLVYEKIVSNRLYNKSMSAFDHDQRRQFINSLTLIMDKLK